MDRSTLSFCSHKHLVTLKNILLFALIAVSPATTATAQIRQPATGVDVITAIDKTLNELNGLEFLPFPSGRVRVGRGNLKVQLKFGFGYWARNRSTVFGPTLEFDFIKMVFLERGVTTEPTENLIMVKGEPKKITISSSDEKVFKAVGHTLNLTGPGTANVIVECDGNKCEIPFTVHELPLVSGASAEDVIKALGLPDQKEAVFVEWPDTQFRDGIFYSPEAGTGGSISAEHWRYKKLPGAVIAMRGSSLHEVSSTHRKLKGAPNAPRLKKN